MVAASDNAEAQDNMPLVRFAPSLLSIPCARLTLKLLATPKPIPLFSELWPGRGACYPNLPLHELALLHCDQLFAILISSLVKYGLQVVYWQTYNNVLQKNWVYLSE